MIKFLILVVFSVAVKCDKETVTYAPDVQQNLLQTLTKCNSDKSFGIEYRRLLRTGDKNVRSDPEFKEFLFCVLHEPGFLNDDGTINVKNSVAVYPHKEAMEEAFTRCKEEVGTGKSRADAAYYAFKCFQDISPILVET